MTTKKDTSNTLISIMRGEFIAEESNRKQQLKTQVDQPL